MAQLASGGLATYCCPCGPHRRATVAGLGLVGGTVRSSQDARPNYQKPKAVSTRTARPASVELRMRKVLVDLARNSNRELALQGYAASLAPRLGTSRYIWRASAAGCGRQRATSPRPLSGDRRTRRSVSCRDRWCRRHAPSEGPVLTRLIVWTRKDKRNILLSS